MDRRNDFRTAQFGCLSIAARRFPRRIDGGNKAMKDNGSTTGSWLRAAGVFVLIVLLPDPCLPSAAPQISSIAEEPNPPPTPPMESYRPALPEKRTTKVPILVYHHFSQSISEGSSALRRLTVTAEVFAQQMQYLQDNGYHVITFSDLANYFEKGKELPVLSIIISFDDGWATQFEYALPYLEKYHFSATFFVVTNYIGRPGFISWPQLQTLLSQGMTIGSHSRSHPRLNKITDSAKLWDQIYNSKTILETQLEIPVEEFAYPYGIH